MWIGLLILSAAATVSLAAVTHIDGPGVPTHDMVCPNGGYYPNPKDCAVYYKCIYSNALGIYVPRKYVCDDGTVFSQLSYKHCVKPSKSDRPECMNYEINSI